ncbi:hypothetical protein FJQ98_00460 [Lysinibacillus agricola]|uniref:Uncharacterized protein n=1 Tax=Lysinibacillus agricola TaxID=2590012 RepID=A0ABX7ARQ8_9BACI|nr:MULTISPECIES: hypothetical protein [Lysinibacillus]QQP12642.1 hypothetical protein FJQ98_00460 [Lysinibacillus agricola]
MGISVTDETLQRSGCFLCESVAAATMFYLRESEASAANVFCSESKAAATKRLVETEINHTLW